MRGPGLTYKARRQQLIDPGIEAAVVAVVAEASGVSGVSKAHRVTGLQSQPRESHDHTHTPATLTHGIIEA